ncbi:MAG TPA: dehydratase, partial [Acidimicrobiales bacterium]|nr:dehydratase [Acidimicrobiales bacterium]
MAQTIFTSLDEVRAAVGRRLGVSDWLEIAPDRLERFTAATADHDRGYLALALTNLFLPQLVEVRGASLGVNYGTGTVRFPAPLLAGSRVRGTAELVACDEIPGGVQTTILITVEVDGGDQPACVVES